MLLIPSRRTEAPFGGSEGAAHRERPELRLPSLEHILSTPTLRCFMLEGEEQHAHSYETARAAEVTKQKE